MKFYISYFYQIRFFPRNLIPVSTATWDPKWYHADQGNGYVFRDKRDVINGVRCEVLTPTKIYDRRHDCQASGNKECSQPKDGSCTFMMKYYKYLTEEVPFEELIQSMTKSIQKLRPGADVCLMVHEPSTCPCAERPCLVKWFEENGVELIEWTPPRR